MNFVDVLHLATPTTLHTPIYTQRRDYKRTPFIMAGWSKQGATNVPAEMLASELMKLTPFLLFF